MAAHDSGFLSKAFRPELWQFFARKQPSVQLEAAGNVDATQPALEESANATQTTASTRLKTALLEWTGRERYLVQDLL